MTPGSVRASRWVRLTWGNRNGVDIPEGDPDDNVPPTTLPGWRWTGMQGGVKGVGRDVEM
jgi:hypothetical protein